MTEKIELNLQQENFESDEERLRFLERSIVKRIREVQKITFGLYLENLKLYAEERGIEPGGYTPSIHHEEIRKLREESEKTINQATVDGLNDLRREFENNPALKYFIPEMGALIEVARTMFLAKEIIKYKEYQVMIGAPELSEEELKKQDAIREDMTEGRALIQWHVQQNETDPKYLKVFFMTLRRLLGETGFKNEWPSMERRLRQELGIYKILKKKFNKVESGKPKEDAHHAIDFWAETKDGKKIIFQSKSSSLFGRQGIFDEQDMQKLEEKLSGIPNPAIKYQAEWEGPEPLMADLVRIKKLLKDSEKAKQYAESLGIENPKFYLIVSSANNFEEMTGEPLPKKNQLLEKELDAITK